MTFVSNNTFFQTFLNRSTIFKVGKNYSWTQNLVPSWIIPTLLSRKLFTVFAIDMEPECTCILFVQLKEYNFLGRNIFHETFSESDIGFPVYIYAFVIAVSHQNLWLFPIPFARTRSHKSLVPTHLLWQYVMKRSEFNHLKPRSPYRKEDISVKKGLKKHHCMWNILLLCCDIRHIYMNSHFYRKAKSSYFANIKKCQLD